MALLLKTESQRRRILSLASKYCYEEKHAHFVEAASLQIFDLLRQRFQLREDDRALQSHAAILHDIGCFINKKKHHKFSKYIIDNDQSLELYSDRRKFFISLIVYNHRKRLHKKTLLLPKASKAKVLKLSAILRVADALDHTRDEVSISSMNLTDSELIISIEGVPAERLIGRLNIKKVLFREVFNLDVVFA